MEQELIQQEQTQVEKTYTFEDICPDWNRIMADNGGFIESRNQLFESDDGSTKSIMKCNSCLVGEAHA